MSLILNTVQKVTLSIVPVDAKGFAAPVENVSWSLSNPDVADLLVAEDGMSAVLVTKAIGGTQVNVTADTRIGEDVNLISGALDVTVVASEAVSFSIAAGEPENQ